ncbi:enoyl-CoA hydratase [Bacillaceae bacterium]
MKVKVSMQQGVAKVLLDNPPLNLLSDKVKSDITRTFRQLAKEPSARVILFQSEGEHFCCGADLKEFPERIRNKTAGEVWTRGHEMLASIMEAPQPTIAFITGNALGGGAELASAFDLRIVAPNARIGYPEVLRGVFPGNGGLERLVTLVGEGHAMRLVLTGKPITAEEACRIGLATEMAAEGDGRKYAEDMADYLATLPGTALKAIKRSIRMYADNPSAFFEKGRALFCQVHETKDVQEAVAAFFEKRKPQFTHQ